jgi:hypothetical protein
MINTGWQKDMAMAHAKGILAYAINQGVDWK